MWQLSHPSGLPCPGQMIASAIWDVVNVSHGSLAPLTWCEPPPGLVGSHFQLIPTGENTEAGHARSSTMILENSRVARPLGPRPDAKRPSGVSLCQYSMILFATPRVVSCLINAALSKIIEDLREFKASSRCSDVSGPMLIL